MKIAVFSDTHGNVIMMEKVLITMDTVDLVIHAGDFYRDAVKLSQRLPSLNVKAVVGNCDYPNTSPPELILELEGIKIYVIHGHSLDPGDFYNALIDEGKRVKAQLVIFGHTHLASRFEQEGIIFLNPGSISSPRMGNGPSYGMVQLDDGVIKTEIKEVPRFKV
ncbi:MAG: metallophosphoesterase [Candidatus Contubernalis sp.]|nr:metallophosphoesterase [Candidatus Contubernalis sp.]